MTSLRRLPIKFSLLSLVIQVALLLSLSFVIENNPSLAQSQVSVKKSIEECLSPFLTSASRRDPNEKLIIGPNQVEVWRYESFEQGDLEKKLCDSTRQIIFGRLPSSLGIKELLNRHQRLRELSLVFYRAKTTVDPQLNGQYKQSRQVEVTARFTLLREKVFNLDLVMLKKLLVGSDCVSRAKEILSDLWISEKIMERRDALRTAQIEIRSRYPLQKAQQSQ